MRPAAIRDELERLGDVVNQLYFVYDTNGNLDDEYEEYDKAVDTATSEYVAYGYDNSTGTGYDGAWERPSRSRRQASVRRLCNIPRPAPIPAA